MGAHYGSVQVWSKDHKRVKAVAEQIAGELKIRMFIGPEIHGWVGIYPQDNGQDQLVGQAIAQHLDDYVLTLLVHDDDIFAYWLYQSGQLVDSYWSVPGYFGDEDLQEQEKMAGNPERFRPIIGSKAEDLSKVLARAESLPTLASEQLDHFAGILGIANTLAAYEYLKEGETDGIKEWKHFQELPQSDIAAEKQRRRQEREQIKKEWKSLRDRGILLWHEESKDSFPFPCACHDGFLVMWLNHRTDRVTFNLHQVPWRDPVAKTLEYPSHPTTIASHTQRHLLAIAGQEQVRIWNTSGDEWTFVKDIKQPFISQHMCISADAQQICRTYHAEAWINDMNTGRCTLNHPLESGLQSAIHPDGKWLAVASSTLGICQLDAKTPWCDFHMGGVVRHQSLLEQFRMSSEQLQKWEDEYRVLSEKNIRHLETAEQRTGYPTVTKDEIAAMRQNVEDHIKEFKATISRISDQSLETLNSSGKEIVRSIGFSRDGRWLWCGTTNGLRVYAWSQIPRTSGTELPNARWTFLSDNERSTIYSIVEEAGGAGILFGNVSGLIYRMDLSTGQVDELLKPPGNNEILCFVFSADGKSLGVAMQTARPKDETERNRVEKRYWTILNYAKLKEKLH